MKQLPLSGEIKERIVQAEENAQNEISEKSKTIAIAVSAILTDAEKTSELLVEGTQTGFTYLTGLPEEVIKEFEKEDGFVLTAGKDRYFVPTEVAEELANQEYVFRLNKEEVTQEGLDISEEILDNVEEGGGWTDKTPEMKVIEETPQKTQDLGGVEDYQAFVGLLKPEEKLKFEQAYKNAEKGERWSETAEKMGFYALLQLVKKQKDEKLAMAEKPRKKKTLITDVLVAHPGFFEKSAQSDGTLRGGRDLLEGLVAMKARGMKFSDNNQANTGS